DPEYQKGHVCRGTAKALLVKVYATIGSASMKSGEITVKGGPGSAVNPDETVSRLMPTPIKHQKTLVAGYEEFDSQEYYRLAREKALEVINDGEFQLAKSQDELWSPANKNGQEFQFCLQTVASDGSLYYNYVCTDYLGYPKETDNGTWSSGYYVQRDHWLQLFEDWDDDRIDWGVIHRVPISYNENTQKMTYCFYPERDSVYVRKGEKGYDKTDILRTDAHLYGSKLRKFAAVSVPMDGNRADFNWPYMRYAETLLFLAEAENELNGPTAAVFGVLDQLNARNNSTLSSEKNAKVPFTKESLRSYILEERVKELAAEGIRRFDLLRWGIYLQVMNAIGNTDENNVVKRREAKHLLLPLPLDVVNTNPHIESNNPGW
ncbi:MAG: RagB/SusD family nutrient uptake outer membrane protein, partial [Bacteroidales bacterium]